MTSTTTSKHDSVILKEEPITQEEQIALIRNPELQRYLPKDERPPAMRDSDLFSFQPNERLMREHEERLAKDFAEEAKFYDHAFLDERVLNEKHRIDEVKLNLKRIGDEQSEFGFILGGWVKFFTSIDKYFFTLKFKPISLNNFKGLRLGHVDLMTSGYSHPYYEEMNNILVDMIDTTEISKTDALVSLLYQPDLDFRPFDFGMVILDINNCQALLKFGNTDKTINFGKEKK